MYKQLKDISDIVSIDDMNMGLYERDKADVKIEKDIQNVELDVNGKNYVYNYDRKNRNPEMFGDGYFQPDGDISSQHFGTVGVAFGYPAFNGLYENVTYKRPIYEADYSWDGKNASGKDTGRELEVYVTYKITLVNQSTSITTRINNFIDYFDDSYDMDSAEVYVGTSDITDKCGKGQSAYAGFKYIKVNRKL